MAKAISMIKITPTVKRKRGLRLIFLVRCQERNLEKNVGKIHQSKAEPGDLLEC